MGRQRLFSNVARKAEARLRRKRWSRAGAGRALPGIKGRAALCGARPSEDLRAHKEARRGGGKGSAKPPACYRVNGVKAKAVFAENSRPESSDGSRIGKKRGVFSVAGDRISNSRHIMRHTVLSPERGRRSRPKQVQGPLPLPQGVRGARSTPDVTNAHTRSVLSS